MAFLSGYKTPKRVSGLWAVWQTGAPVTFSSKDFRERSKLYMGSLAEPIFLFDSKMHGLNSICCVRGHTPFVKRYADSDWLSFQGANVGRGKQSTHRTMTGSSRWLWREVTWGQLGWRLLLHFSVNQEKPKWSHLGCSCPWPLESSA